MKNKNKTLPFLHINLLIKYSVQQQIHFNSNTFGNKMLSLQRGFTVLIWTWTWTIVMCALRRVRTAWIFTHSDQVKMLTRLSAKQTMTILIRLRERADWAPLASRKHTYIILTPETPLLYSKTGVYRGIHYFSYFCSKHRFWVLVRIASTRRF